MKIYGHPGSTCTRKVLTLFAEKGHTPELVTIDLGKGEHKQPAHLARQPFGQIPVLDDDGFILYESGAICRYLDEKLGGPALLPTELKTRAHVEQWLSIDSANFTPHAMKIIYATVFGPMRGQPIDEAKLEEGRKALAVTLDIMNAQLATSAHIAGLDFTLADICFMPYIEYIYAGKQGDLIESRPAVANWWHLISDRKSWKTVTHKATL